MPVQGNALKGVPSDNRLGLGLLLGRNRIDALSQHPLSLQALLPSICETNDGIIAKRGQPLSSIRFHIPEAPAFAAIGVNEEVKTVAIEKLVGAVSRLGRTAGGVSQGSSSTSHKGKPLYRIDFIPNVTPKSAGSCRIPTERHNEKTRQKAGFTGVPEILVAFAGT